jgi:hypothetical protein
MSSVNIFRFQTLACAAITEQVDPVVRTRRLLLKHVAAL